MGKEHDPFWTVRGVYEGQDVCLVIEGVSQTAAECFATKRGVDVVFIEEATHSDIAAAKLKGLLWRYTPEVKLKCFGRPVNKLQAVCLLLCGAATIFVNLRAAHILLPIRWSF